MKVFFSLIIFMSTLTCSYGKEQKKGWGLSLGEGTSNIRIGGRLQGIGEYYTSNGSKDLYLRRTRVNLQYETERFHLIYLDLRNDNANQADSGERNFSIGDAFYEVPLPMFNFIDNLTLFRSKVDVSYSQTASSKDLINPNREAVSDYAANFMVHNRRATNIQINGGNSWMTYQLVLSDGINSQSVETPFGSVEVESILEQSLTYGGKLRVFLWDPNKRKAEPKETFYGAENHISLGFGAFANLGVKFLLSNGKRVEKSRRMYNAELSIARGPLRILAEGFIFDGDPVNMSQLRFGRSVGGYVRGEYLMGKIAPYFGLMDFKRDTKVQDSHQTSQLVGVNYYAKNKSRRYGISFRNSEFDKSFGAADTEEFMAYIMLDY